MNIVALPFEGIIPKEFVEPSQEASFRPNKRILRMVAIVSNLFFIVMVAGGGIVALLEDDVTVRICAGGGALMGICGVYGISYFHKKTLN